MIIVTRARYLPLYNMLTVKFLHSQHKTEDFPLLLNATVIHRYKKCHIYSF